MSVAIDMSNLQSVKLTLGVANLKRAMDQDSQNVAKIIGTMEETTAKTLEMSVTPYKGANIDLKI